MRYIVGGISKRARIISDTGDWLKGYEWKHFGTFTFRKDISPVTAERCFNRFISRFEGDINYFYVLEKHSVRRCDHIHCVFGYIDKLICREIRKRWRKYYGMVSVVLYMENRGGLYYLCKRIGDVRTEWGFELSK